MVDSLVGRTLGQYEVHGLLGRGGMASVYRGYQPSLGRAVAIKTLPLHGIADSSFPARFRREARLAAGLMHPNIVPVFDFGEWDDLLYIVMAHVDGGTLAERVHDSLPRESGIRLVGQVADALGYAHVHGVVHRDVKPQNVLLASADWAMVSDFGIARAVGETTDLTGRARTIGTPRYMAPEQWVGGHVDGRVDLYALGIVLFEVLTGSPPYLAPTPEGLMRQHMDEPVPSVCARCPDIPAAFDDVLQVALAKAPEQRFRHAAEFKRAIQDAARFDRAGSKLATDVRSSDGSIIATRPYIGPTVRVTRSEGVPSEPPAGRRSGVRYAIAGTALFLTVGASAGLGFLAARTATGGGGIDSQVQPTAILAPSAPTADGTIGVAPSQQATGTVVPTTRAIATQAPAQSVLTPTLAIGNIPVPSPLAATPRVTTTTAPLNDGRRAEVESRIAQYFTALNAGDFGRAQAACCTPRWRQQNPVDEWRHNFSGVTDLRFARPIRFISTESNRIVAEVDYSFLNASGQRLFFTLRWTFVPSGQDWLADEAVASPQR